jgi:LacI family transcriptional regulator
VSSARVSIQDVAQAAGVSSATVSRVLTGARSVRPESAAAVQAAVAQLNYRPNQLGRALRRQSTQVIGMVVPSIDNPFFPSVIQTVERNLRARGYALLLSTSEDDPQVEAERVEMLVDRQVDGLLISPCRRTESKPALVDAAARVPLVQFDRAIEGRSFDFVGVDDSQGIRSIVDLVTGIKPRRVAYLGGDVTNWSGNQRHAAFVALAGERRRQLRTVVRLGEFSERWGHEAALELLSTRWPPDAFVCGNDLIAVGVVEACEELGLSVPGDVVVSGYDDIALSRMCRPPLTTVRQPVGELSARAVAMLLDRAHEPQRRSRRVLLRTDLVIRQSMPQVDGARAYHG